MTADRNAAAGSSEPEEPPIRFTDNRKIDRERGGSATGAAAPAAGSSGAVPAEPTAPTAPSEQPGGADTALLDERTRDLQRLQAEYANYRKRAERDRLAAGDLAVGKALAELLPVVDDLDRARAHGDLTGALKAVADKLEAGFAKLGLEAFGEVGDAFDPSIHEAVLHDESDQVTVPTCTTIMRQGYRHHDRLLRAAMVGVSDPVTPAPPTSPITDAEGEAEAATTAPAEQSTDEN